MKEILTISLLYLNAGLVGGLSVESHPHNPGLQIRVCY